MKDLVPRPIRAWIYGIALAAVPVLVYTGVMEPEGAALALPLILAILNLNPDHKAEAAPYQAKHAHPDET